MSEDQEGYESIVTEDQSREDNIKLWRSVEKTPTSQVRPAQINGMNIKSVKPHYQRMKATEVFGPFGKGWGVIEDENSFKQHQIGDTHLLKYSAILWYKQDGERFEFPIHATEKEAYVTNQGKGYLKIDDTADKKVGTNALTKGLSFLGFSADVFHGLYDDASYINMLKNEEGVEADITKKQDHSEYSKFRKQAVANMLLSKSTGSLEKEFFAAMKKMQEKNDPKGIVELTDAKNKRWKELT